MCKRSRSQVLGSRSTPPSSCIMLWSSRWQQTSGHLALDNRALASIEHLCTSRGFGGQVRRGTCRANVGSGLPFASPGQDAPRSSHLLQVPRTCFLAKSFNLCHRERRCLIPTCEPYVWLCSYVSTGSHIEKRRDFHSMQYTGVARLDPCICPF